MNVEPSEIQLKLLYEALCQKVPFQWQLRYIEVLADGTLMFSFENITNRSWRALYNIQQNGQWERRYYYV